MISAKDIGTERHGWSQVKTRHMCILSGCDYLKSLNGIGLVKAEKSLLTMKDGYAVNCMLRKDMIIICISGDSEMEGFWESSLCSSMDSGIR